jgi:hypothetical protein
MPQLTPNPMFLIGACVIIHCNANKGLDQRVRSKDLYCSFLFDCISTQRISEQLYFCYIFTGESRKVSSFYESLRRGTVGVLMKERLCTDRGRLTHICSLFRPGASQRQKLKARGNRRHLLYTTLHFTTALDESLYPVVTPHGPSLSSRHVALWHGVSCSWSAV